jgi:hypothetical protein
MGHKEDIDHLSWPQVAGLVVCIWYKILVFHHHGRSSPTNTIPTSLHSLLVINILSTYTLLVYRAMHSFAILRTTVF